MSKNSVRPNIPPKKGEFSHKERQLVRRSLLWMRGPHGIILGIILVGFAIYFAPRFMAPQEAEQPEREVEHRTEYQRILASENVDDLKYASNRLQLSMNERELPEQILALKAQMSIASRLDQIAAKTDDNQNGMSALIRLHALIYWDRLNREHELSESDKGEDLRNYAATLLESENSEIVKEARIALAFSYCHEFAQTENEESLKHFEARASEIVQEDLNDQESMFKVYEMVRIVSLAHADVEANQIELVRRFGDALVKSDDALVRQVGGQLNDMTIIGTTNYEDLLFKISFGDEGAIARAKQIIEGADSSDKLSSAIFFHGIQVAEMLQLQGRNGEANALNDQLAATLSTQREEVKKTAGRLLENFRRRSQLVGMTFDLSATKPDGSVINFSDFKEKPVVVFFMSLDDKSRETMAIISDMKPLYDDGVRFLGVATKPTLRTRRSIAPNPADFNRIAGELWGGLVNRFKFVQFVPVIGSQRLLDQCPIQTAPYLLILNEAHQVIARNADSGDIRSILAASGWSMN